MTDLAPACGRVHIVVERRSLSSESDAAESLYAEPAVYAHLICGYEIVRK